MIAKGKKADNLFNLTGAGARDTFVFQSVGDSTIANYDIITNFVHGSDHLDISATAHGAVVVQSLANGWTNIFWGTSGAEGDIAVHGQVTAADLIVGAGAHVDFIFA